jgi:protein gp37
VSTGIEWTAETWNPLAAFDRETGERGWFCTKVSAGCANCYAEAMNQRLGTGHAYAVPNLEKVEFRLVNLDRPLKWQESGKHVRVFVNSMTDLFHEDVSVAMLDQMFDVMVRAPDLTFQILTKRPERMAEYMASIGRSVDDWPPGNIWLGTSVENQEAADERIPHLLDTPAAVRFLSCEPLLDAVNLHPWLKLHPKLDWVIVGGESGFQARPMDLDWARWIVEACQHYGVAPFVKQLGSDWAGSPRNKGGDIDRFPPDLRVREYPDEAEDRMERYERQLPLL